MFVLKAVGKHHTVNLWFKMGTRLSLCRGWELAQSVTFVRCESLFSRPLVTELQWVSVGGNILHGTDNAYQCALQYRGHGLFCCQGCLIASLNMMAFTANPTTSAPISINAQRTAFCLSMVGDSFSLIEFIKAEKIVAILTDINSGILNKRCL